MVLALENVENKKEMVRCQRRAVLPCKVVWGAPSIHQKWWVNTQTKPHCCKEKHQQALYVVLSWNPKQCDFLSKKNCTLFALGEVSNTHYTIGQSTSHSKNISKLKLPAQLSAISVAVQSLNVSTTPIMAMGCRQYLPLSVVQLNGKHCRKPHCCNGVVDTLRL